LVIIFLYKGGDAVKKFFVLLTTLMITLLFVFLYVKYTQNKYKDITYTVERHMTTGLFNSHKLYSINNLELTFSDNIVAVVNVYGLQKKVPHMQVSYKVFLEKKKDGTWKVQRVYPLS
jgi:hypothetical protein